MAQRPIHDMEKKWQEYWAKNGTYRAQAPTEHPTGEKFYGLVEFPYPSGDGLHVGHPRSYVAIDLVTRKRRMEGKNVLYPIGWDAFGLPTENYAIKHKIKPADATKKNVANFTRQIQSLGVGFDWMREVNTTDPAYYKWTQWQFLQFVKAGLAYKAATTINWCPRCKIGLANEEAQGGVCERCGNPVEKREKAQWMIKITKYAERLIKDLDNVNYLEKIRKQQIDWIGKSEGAEIYFQIVDTDERVEVFTTRPDTIFGVTYVVLAPEHPFVQKWLQQGKIQNGSAVQTYIDQVKNKTDIERTADNKEKTGVPLQGVSVINPVNGKIVPVWIADYALANYGTGAVMAVPAHDERDLSFAQKFQLPMKQVVAPYILVHQFPLQEGKETTKRRVVSAIVHRTDTDEYLLLDTVDGRRVFPGGGVEEGETLEQAVRREITEETGYTDMQIKACLVEGVYGHGFKPKKDSNCFDLDTGFLVEVSGEPAQSRSAEDLVQHQMLWKKKEAVTEFLNLEHHRFIWNWYIDGKGSFVEEGINFDSGFLDRLTTAEAKKAATVWLEKHGAGKGMTTYRLRDWVFSRQRYWGEPIPLVHCDACAKKKQKVLVLHGFSSNPTMIWYPWIKAELEKQGFEVMIPTLPTSNGPTVEAWTELLMPYLDQLGEDDVIVGHSIGGRMALELIERSQKKIGHLILTAPAIGIYPPDRYAERLSAELDRKADFDFLRDFIAKPVQWDRITSNVGSAVVLWSNDDPMVQKPTHPTIPAGWNIQVLDGQGHFWGDQQPDVLDQVVSRKVSGWIAIPDTQLPLTLPDVDAYEPTDNGESPLAKITDWVKTTCPKCGGPAERETDTMPNWAGSSWYFLRYCDPHNDTEFASAENLKYWMPVNLYNGGMEHTTLHLLYSRFWHKFLWDMGYIPAECGSEPYSMRRSHNMILGEGGVKMSKSKGNVINPDDVVKDYGSDVFRVYEMFIGPYDQPAPWDTNGIEGVRRFLDKVWNLFESKSDVALTPEVETLYHQTIKKVTDGIENLQFNTCVSQMMILTNAFQEAGGIPVVCREGFLKILAPYAPHIAEELWEMLGHKETIHRSGWPTYDASKLVGSTFELVIQINGKVRDKMVVDTDISEDDAKAKVLASEKVQGWLEGKEPKKVVYVKGKLVSIVM